MKTKDNKIIHLSGQKEKEDKTELPGYPGYPAGEDIYGMFKEENNIDPEDISKSKKSVEKRESGKNNEKDFTEDKSGRDLDVPGAELDDEQEKNGNEDEENNLYSLGGDNHNDLDEN